MNNRIGVKGEIDLPMNREDVGDPSSNAPLTVDLFRKDLREKPSCRRAVGLPTSESRHARSFQRGNVDRSPPTAAQPDNCSTIEFWRVLIQLPADRPLI
jgi:hypothetical protein